MENCCADCKLEKENPAKYRLVMRFRDHLSHEEMHDRYARSTKAMNNGMSGYHREMLDWHKNERIKVQAEIRKLG
jgi:hypothetical protein